ncbi:MAG: DNA polymerase III subunit alpha, partial [Candidatus Hydrogenedentes bacterium]|nr:DNA polymerase III subunit alpha [Candidatus Hydrogenedentota bacterium]
ELYVAPGSCTEKDARGSGRLNNHFLLLCENETGYHNLCRLSSLGYIKGFHYKPRVDLDLLEKYKEGLIASSACLAGEIPQLLIEDKWDEANEAVRRYVAIYGRESFLIELMDHGIPEQKKINPKLAELAEHHGLTLIATNDSHYTDKADSDAHDALLCIQTNAMVDDAKRFRFSGPDYYFTSPEEMRQKFKEWPEAVSNTEKIAERCNVEIPLGQHLIPKSEPPQGFTKEGYLRHLVGEGLKERYDEQPSDEHVSRADYELGIIEQMGFVDYFLVVYDLIDYARGQDIPVGPGRGSGAGSLVAYALKITNIDPIRYGLLFERFLNPERVSMPDFDLDFCFERRGEVIEYVRDKYGKDKVAQIITFGRMLAKQAIRNVGRVLGIPYGDADRVAKLIPEELKITLKAAYSREPALQQAVKEDPGIERLWDLALRLEGTIGNCGTHAAGVVICDQPLTDHVPLFKAKAEAVVATQFEMKGVEQVGLLKMDFLGLRTLTVVHNAVENIRKNRGTEIDIDNLEPDDDGAYEAIHSGHTAGIFQLESSGMRDLAKRIGLESLEEICALIALYRPGPMQLKDTYIENKHHPEKIKYDHPLLEPILRETYGVALYQEQVMRIVRAAAGFTLGQADILRRAMGKKDPQLMARQRARFVEGCKEHNNIKEDMATILFDRIEQFAGYGFNKSHSMAYAYVAYQTAYLKANYTAEFMAALLTSESGNLNKVAMYIAECQRLGIQVLPPDVNYSEKAFTVEGDNIRFGLSAVKNAGEDVVEEIVRKRAEDGLFSDIYDFCARLTSKYAHRRILESLNAAGAFTSTGWNRREVEHELENAIDEGKIAQRDLDSGQTSLFDLMESGGETTSRREKPNLDEWPEHELLIKEKEVLGLYVTSNPLAPHGDILERYVTLHISELPEMREGTDVVVGGLLSTVKHYTTNKGKRMAWITLETLEGPCEVTVFPELYEKRGGLLVEDMIVMMDAKVNFRNNEAGLVAEDIIPIEEAEQKMSKAVHIRLTTIGLDHPLLERLAYLLDDYPGPCDVYLHCQREDKTEVVIHAPGSCRVTAAPELKTRVAEMLGAESLWFSGANGYPRHDS